MKHHKLLSLAIISLLVLIPGNVLTSDYSHSFFKIALDVSGKFSAKYGRAAELHKKLLNRIYLSPSLFEKNHIIAYYGHPKSKIMGIVGRHAIPELAAMLKKEAENYDSVNKDKGVIPAFYLIYGTCQPEGEINIIDTELLEKYIEFAINNGFLIYLDHQIGKYSVEQALDQILPFLKYPNVHLALDPEWRTTKPMKEVGSISGTELNRAQNKMKEYMAAKSIQGKRQLVVHQFQNRMIKNIKDVKTVYDPVILVHCHFRLGKSRKQKKHSCRECKGR